MALIKCPECGSEISDKAESCPRCGYKQKPDATVDSRSDRLSGNEPKTRPRKSNTRLFVLLGILGILLIIFLSVVFAGIKSRNPNFSFIPREHRTSLVSGSIIAPSSQYKYYEFSTGPNWLNITVSGSFQASGGSGNDIRVMVMTKNDFINFTNNHAYKFFYNSGKTTVSNVNVALPSKEERYVLVFDNAFSVVSDKEVTANIYLGATY